MPRHTSLLSLPGLALKSCCFFCFVLPLQDVILSPCCRCTAHGCIASLNGASHKWNDTMRSSGRASFSVLFAWPCACRLCLFFIRLFLPFLHHESCSEKSLVGSHSLSPRGFLCHKMRSLPLFVFSPCPLVPFLFFLFLYFFGGIRRRDSWVGRA